MCRSRFLSILWIICVSISFACGKEETAPQPEAKRALPTAAEKKKILSEAKLQEVRDLRGKLAEKVTSLAKTNEQFDREIGDSAKTIQAEAAQGSTKAFEQAIQNRRIKAALEAIQKAQAYKEIVERESRLAGEASVETEGAEKQLRLDIIMLASVDEAKLDELLAKLDLVINKIQPQAKDLVLKDAQTNLKPLEDIYKELTTPANKATKQPDINFQKPKPPIPSSPATVPVVNGHIHEDDDSDYSTETQLSLFDAPCKRLPKPGQYIVGVDGNRYWFKKDVALERFAKPCRRINLRQAKSKYPIPNDPPYLPDKAKLILAEFDLACTAMANWQTKRTANKDATESDVDLIIESFQKKCQESDKLDFPRP